MRDVLQNASPTTSGTPTIVSATGGMRGMRGLASSATSIFYTRANLSGMSACTVLMIAADVSAADAAVRYMFAYGSSSSNAPIIFLSPTANTNQLTFSVRDNSNTFRLNITSAAAVFPMAGPSVVVGVYGPPSGSLWVDGVRVASGSAAAHSGITMDRTTIGAMRRAATLAGPDATYGLCVAWNRALSDDEVLALSENPWQLFEGEARLVPYSTAGSYTLVADGATYSYTAGDAGLTLGRRLEADGATYAYSAGDAGLTLNRRLVADGATYAYTAGDATLVYTPAGSYTLVADGATYTLTAGSANLTVSRRLVAEGATYTYTAGDATLTYSGAQSAVAAEVWNYELAPGVTAGEMLIAIYTAMTTGQVPANVTHIRGIPLVGTGVVGDEFGVMQ